MPTPSGSPGSAARLVGEGRLQLDRRPERAARRAEDGQRLVAAQLDQLAAPGLDALAGDLREACREAGRGLVAVLRGEARVAPDIRDQEGPDGGAALAALG